MTDFYGSDLTCPRCGCQRSYDELEFGCNACGYDDFEEEIGDDPFFDTDEEQFRFDEPEDWE